MDTIFIKGLKIHAPIGFYAWEPAIGRTIIIDINMVLKPRNRISLDETVDYEKASNLIKEMVLSTPVKLLEELAEKISNLLFGTFDVIENLSLTLTKPGAVKGVEAVGFMIQRKKDN